MRQDWDKYFMDVAKVVSTRATCDRKYVGAVIVKNRIILSTGYNGSVSKADHCHEAGHMMEDGHCVRTVHSEANAIVQAAKNGVSIDDATIYVTASPCWNCFKLIANSGIKKIVFGEFYRDNRVFEYAKISGIELVDLSKPTTIPNCRHEIPPEFIVRPLVGQIYQCSKCEAKLVYEGSNEGEDDRDS